MLSDVPHAASMHPRSSSRCSATPEYALKLFLPMAPASAEAKRLQVVVRAAGDPVPLAQAVRRGIRDAAPGNTVTSAYTFDQIITVMGQEMLVGTAPLAPLIAIGMLLTTAGIYGVLAFANARRSRELAVRVAIGASGRDLVRLVTAHSFRLVALGSSCGIGVTFVLARVVRASGGAGSIYDPGLARLRYPSGHRRRDRRDGDVDSVAAGDEDQSVGAVENHVMAQSGRWII
jgi:hypothetical protein